MKLKSITLSLLFVLCSTQIQAEESRNTKGCRLTKAGLELCIGQEVASKSLLSNGLISSVTLNEIDIEEVSIPVTMRIDGVSLVYNQSIPLSDLVKVSRGLEVEVYSLNKDIIGKRKVYPGDIVQFESKLNPQMRGSGLLLDSYEISPGKFIFAIDGLGFLGSDEVFSIKDVQSI